MRYYIIALLVMSLPTYAGSFDRISQKQWIHGSENCKSNTDPGIEIFQFNETTYILRQNKCVNFEAPFIYVLFGEHTVLVHDTGATVDEKKFPLYKTVTSLISARHQPDNSTPLRILVSHSHSHNDHTAGDSQFRGKANVKLIEPNERSMHSFFGFSDWPHGAAAIDLGQRRLNIVPVPGHLKDSIAIYDSQTQWLLSGDTFYPGRLYIDDWSAYLASIARLVDFTESNTVSVILGSHIEMSKQAGKAYSLGSTFQPNEASLVLSVQDLLVLHNKLTESGEDPKKTVLEKFVIHPLGFFHKLIAGTLKILGF
jgi:glyoxylase-like metal-dependent hydrolase (beta-lactamase superfamily II)